MEKLLVERPGAWIRLCEPASVLDTFRGYWVPRVAGSGGLVLRRSLNRARKVVVPRRDVHSRRESMDIIQFHFPAIIMYLIQRRIPRRLFIPSLFTLKTCVFVLFCSCVDNCVFLSEFCVYVIRWSLYLATLWFINFFLFKFLNFDDYLFFYCVLRLA